MNIKKIYNISWIIFFWQDKSRLRWFDIITMEESSQFLKYMWLHIKPWVNNNKKWEGEVLCSFVFRDEPHILVKTSPRLTSLRMYMIHETFDLDVGYGFKKYIFIYGKKNMIICNLFEWLEINNSTATVTDDIAGLLRFTFHDSNCGTDYEYLCKSE